LQDLLSEQRAQNKLTKAFDQHVAFQNIRSARDGNVHTIVDMAIETNVDALSFVSTELTAADFNPCDQGHCIHARLCKGHSAAVTCANSKHQRGVAVAWRVESKKGKGKPSFDFESFQRHGPNCPSHHCLFGGERWPVVVACLLLDTLEDLPHVQAAFNRFTGRCPPVLMADLNVDLCFPAPDTRT